MPSESGYDWTPLSPEPLTVEGEYYIMSIEYAGSYQLERYSATAVCKHAK